MYTLEILCSNLKLFCLDCVASDYLSRKEDPVALSHVPIVRTAYPHKISYSLFSPFFFPPSLPPFPFLIRFPFLLPFPYPSSPILFLIFLSSTPLLSLCFYSFFSSSPFLSSSPFPPLPLPLPLSLLSSPLPLPFLPLFYFLSLNFVI